MELKRYALLNDNKIVEIYKKEKFGYSYIDEVINDIICTRSILISDVKTTSDNFLDLIEVGDLVCLNEDYFNIGSVIHEVLEIRGTFIRVLTYAISQSDVKAIYKRQTNGDYKRYEVGGKE